MGVRGALIAVVAAVSATASAAEPARSGTSDERAKVAQPAPVPVVLASASDVRPSASVERAQEPVRHLAPRVTHCRCGDPQTPQDQPAEDQPEQ